MSKNRGTTGSIIQTLGFTLSKQTGSSMIRLNENSSLNFSPGIFYFYRKRRTLLVVSFIALPRVDYNVYLNSFSVIRIFFETTKREKIKIKASTAIKQLLNLLYAYYLLTYPPCISFISNAIENLIR